MRDPEAGPSRSRSRLRPLKQQLVAPDLEQGSRPLLKSKSKKQIRNEEQYSPPPLQVVAERAAAIPRSPPQLRQLLPSPPPLSSSQPFPDPSSSSNTSIDPAIPFAAPQPTQTTSTDPLATRTLPSTSESAPPLNNTTWSGSSAFNGTVSTPMSSTSSSSSHSSSTSKAPKSTSTYSGPWTYTANPSKTTSGNAASKTTYVPGVVFDLNLAGDTDTQAVYSVPMTFGHDSGYRRKRGGTYQTLNMLVDLGSSDMWAAVKSCKTPNCKSASKLFDNSASLAMDDPLSLTLQYETGSAHGNIMWEQVTLGSFGIAYQAFLAAEKIYNEDLGGGQFQGLLGLALPANSLIEDKIPGTTGSNPDGATFLDNLFGAGASAPSQRLFSLSLERREDSRTLSSLGIGAVDERLCPLPCAPDFVPIVPHANLGRTGYLHWRVPLRGMKAYTFSNAAAGQGPTSKNITLGRSLSDPVQAHPMAVLDSGGVQILVGSRTYADAIYGAYGISADADGKYRMPCTQPLTFSFLIGDNEFPVHPLDMSWPDPDDESRQMCIGAVQVSNNLGIHGDIVLGSTFLKNVYSVYKYPDQKSSTSWQPSVGLVSLINQSTASSDFYAVRNKHMSLTTVSSTNGKTNPSNPVSGAADATQHRIVSTTIIAVCSVIGFFVLAAGAFCAWWFWFRRKVGAHGVVEYKMAPPPEDPPTGHKSVNSMSTLRSKKHEETKRQRSMVDGFSDYEIDSWRSTTDTIALGNLLEVNENDDHTRTRTQSMGDSLSNHTRGSSLHQSLLAASDGPPSPLADFYPRDPRGNIATASDRHERSLSVDRDGRERRRSWDTRSNTMQSRLSEHRLSEHHRPEFPRASSAGTIMTSPGSANRLIDLNNSPPTSPASVSYPNLPAIAASPRNSSISTRSQSISMTGPFPAARLSSHRGSDLDEYFPVLPPSSPDDRSRRPSNSSHLSRGY